MPTPAPSLFFVNWQPPQLPVIGNAAPRIRNALDTITNAPRQRMTLVLVLAFTFVLALGAFAYLLLRRR